MGKLFLGLFTFVNLSFAASPQDASKAILKMAGCYLVDYSYAETQALKPGYTLDSRVYDVNREKSVMEYIFPVQASDTKIRLQHVLFMADLGGKVNPDTFLKHQAEDWEFQADYLYDFQSPAHWDAKKITAPSTWVRRITNLDDGLRYQCASAWNLDNANPEWKCSNYAPIPGRETRDMGRKDYQTLQRETRVMLYGSSWLERQDNVKTIHTATERTPLAREVGKTWYVRIPDSACTEAAKWAEPRKAFWALLQNTWEEVLDGKAPFIEKAVAGKPGRPFRMADIEEAYYQTIENNPVEANKARKEILDLIEEYRAH